MLRQQFDAGAARAVERCAVPFIHLLAQGRPAYRRCPCPTACPPPRAPCRCRAAWPDARRDSRRRAVVCHIEISIGSRRTIWKRPGSVARCSPVKIARRRFGGEQFSAASGSGVGQRHVRRRQIGQQRVAPCHCQRSPCSLKLQASPRRYSGAPSVSATRQCRPACRSPTTAGLLLRKMPAFFSAER